MKDYLVKALTCEERVRVYICCSTAMVEEARTRFDMYPTSAAALGRVMSVGSMMGSMLKSDKEQITIKMNGGGPIGTVLVDAYSDGHVRGFVSDPHIMLQYNDTGKLAVGMAVGNQGTLEVIKDLHMKENWGGTVELQSGEIGDDFAYYFTASEQTPSAVSVGVLVDVDNSILAAGGLIIQMMPDASEEDIVKVEHIVSTMKHISTYIQEFASLEDILKELFHEDLKILSSQEICFKCDCDKSKMKRVITTLSKEERMAMIEEDHGCEITCNFCNEQYNFSEEELCDLEKFIEAHART